MRADARVKTNGSKRSSKWPSVRKAYLKDHPACAVCGATEKDGVKIEVHHKKPFHLHPEFELDPSNFITLCEGSKDGSNHHLFIGHADNFKGYNPDVEDDSLMWSKKIADSKEMAKRG